jgi:hypothetical protein
MSDEVETPEAVQRRIAAAVRDEEFATGVDQYALKSDEVLPGVTAEEYLTDHTFGGRVTRTLTLGDHGDWSETVTGPGGEMHHHSHTNSVYGPYPFDGHWTDLDGTRHECPTLPEGSDYGECIEAVYGPGIWAELQKRIASTPPRAV